jgi:predicted RNase H-like nuclease (RuvC/YqgF family)
MQQLAGNPIQAGPLHQNQENALLADQFHLMNIAAEQQDDNTARFLQSFQSFAAQILESNKALSDRIAVLEAEKAAASENAKKETLVHRDEVKAQANQIKALTTRLDEVSGRLSEASQKIQKLETHTHIKAHDIPIRTGMTNLSNVHPDNFMGYNVYTYRYDPSYTEGPFYPEVKR